MARASVAPGHVTSTFIVSPSCKKKMTIMFLSFIKKKKHCFSSRDPHLDLVAGGLVSLPVGPSLSSAVASNHILIQLLGDIQIRHANQVAAMLQADVQDNKKT